MIGLKINSIIKAQSMKYVVFGGLTGWIGQKIVELLCETSDVLATGVRMQDRHKVQELLESEKPERVIISAGLTGRPNVDWCEDHQREVIEANVLGVITVVEECKIRDIHVTYLGTGCIYEYPIIRVIDYTYSAVSSGKYKYKKVIKNDETIRKEYTNLKPNRTIMDYNKKYKETDEPNFEGSFYSKTKIMVETLLKSYDNVLTLRIRMPISDDLHPRNFVTKILKYEKIVNIPNSMSVLSDLLPILVDMSKKGLTGIYNFCNPGSVSHNEIMELYKELVDPNLKWTNFTLDEQSKVLKAGRSNCELDCSKLLELYNIPSAKESIRKIFENL